VRVGVGVALGFGVGVAVGFGVGVAVGFGVGEEVGEGVAVTLGRGVCVGLGLGVAVAVGRGVAESTRVGVGEGAGAPGSGSTPHTSWAPTGRDRSYTAIAVVFFETPAASPAYDGSFAAFHRERLLALGAARRQVHDVVELLERAADVLREDLFVLDHQESGHRPRTVAIPVPAAQRPSAGQNRWLISMPNVRGCS